MDHIAAHPLDGPAAAAPGPASCSGPGSGSLSSRPGDRRRNSRVAGVVVIDLGAGF